MPSALLFQGLGGRFCESFGGLLRKQPEGRCCERVAVLGMSKNHSADSRGRGEAPEERLSCEAPVGGEQEVTDGEGRMAETMKQASSPPQELQRIGLQKPSRTESPLGFWLLWPSLHVSENSHLPPNSGGEGRALLRESATTLALAPLQALSCTQSQLCR